MSQSSEQIEAKLCAYLEGELDEQGRAEIEKHLAGNPAHRRLLAEVARTRDLVRALPRESAPADLCEQFQGHLERAVLLANEAEASALRIGRWRPVLAMAALVVLAVGVGLVIYFGLPSAVPQRTVVSNTPASSGANEAAESKVLMEGASTAPAEPPLAVAQAETDAVLRDRFSADGAGEGKAPNGGSPASVALMSGQAATSPVATSQPLAPSLPALAQQVPKLWSTEQQRALFFARTGAKDASGTAPANAPVYYVISTAQPATASDEIAQELSRLNVEFQTVPGPVTLALHDAAQFGTRGVSGVAREEPLLKKEVNRTEASAEAQGPTTPTGGAGGYSGVALDTAAAAPRPGPAPPAPAQRSAPAPRPAPAPPASAGTEIADASARPPDEQAKDLPAAAERVISPQQQEAQSLILVRNLTRQQADELRASLASRQGPEQQVVVWGEPLADRSASVPQPLPDPQEKRQTSAGVGGAPGASTDFAAVPESRQQTAARSAGPAPQAQVGVPLETESRRADRARSGRGFGGGRGGFAEAPPAPASRGGSSAGAVATAPVEDDVIRRGDSLRVVLGDAPAGQNVHELRVRPDGTVTVPQLGAMSCAGLTVGQLQETLAENFRAANRADADKVVVTKAGKAVAPDGTAQAAKPEALALADANRGRARFAQQGASGEVRPRAATAQRPEAGGEPAARGDIRAGRATESEAVDAPPTQSRRSAAVGQEPAAVEPADAEPSRQPLQERAAAQPADSQPADSQDADPQPSTAPAGGEERVDVVIVVRRFDGDLAEHLAPGAVPPGSPAPADAEPAGPIEKHEILTVTLTPEGADAGAADADGANVENVRVAEDGTIDLPSVGRIQAEGCTSAKLAEEITTAMKRNNAPAGVRVKVTRVGGPATQQAPAPAAQPAEPRQP